MLDGHFTVFGYALMARRSSSPSSTPWRPTSSTRSGGSSSARRHRPSWRSSTPSRRSAGPSRTYFFQSDVSAMFDLLAVYFVIRIGRSDDGRLQRRRLAGHRGRRGSDDGLRERDIHPDHRGVSPVLAASKGGDWSRLSLGFLLASFVGILLMGLYNEAIFGTAFHTTEQVYLNSSTPWESSPPQSTGGLPKPHLSAEGASRLLNLPCPRVSSGFAEMLKQRRYRVETLFLLACFLGVFLPYSAWYDPVGWRGLRSPLPRLGDPVPPPARWSAHRDREPQDCA